MISEERFYGGAQFITAGSGGSYAVYGDARVITVNATATGVIVQLPAPSDITNGALDGGPAFFVINAGTQTLTVRDDGGVTFTIPSAGVEAVCFDSGVMLATPTVAPTMTTEDAIIAGGGAAAAEVATVDRFTVSTETFAAEASMSNARAEGAAAACKQGFYIAQTRGGSNLAEKHRAGSWSALPNLSSAREDGVAEAMGSEAIFFGGDDSAAEALDTITDTWAARSALPLTRAEPASFAWPGGDRIIIVSGDDPAKIALAYHVPTDTFETLDPYSSTPRGDFTAFVHDGRGILAGGRDLLGAVVDDVELFDLATRSWAAGTALPAARTEAGSWAVTDAAGYFGGGLDSASSAASAVYRLRGRSGSWATLGATLNRAFITNQCAGGVV